MMQRIPVFFLILITLWSCQREESRSVSRTYPARPSPAVADRIRQVEHGLLPAMLIDGGENQPWMLADRMEYYRIPGLSVAVINGSRIEWARAYGTKSDDNGDAVTLETIFQVASLSKPLTAAVALRLAEAGLIELDTPLNDQLGAWQLPENEFTANRPVTPRNLLLHTSGLTGFGLEGYPPGAALPSLTQIFQGASPAATPPFTVDFEPGSRWRYSNAGYTLIQQLLVERTGQDFPALMETHLLGPLEMESSTFHQPLPEAHISQAASGHLPDGSLLEGNWRVFPEMAAGGLWTTPMDLCRYLMELQQAYAGQSERLLSPTMAREMLQRQYINFGLGILLGGAGDSLSVTFNGGNPGYRCDMFAYLLRGEGAVIMTNSDNGNRIIPELYRSLAAAYDWPDYRPEPVTMYPVEAADLARFTGIWHAEQEIWPDFDIVVTQTETGLRAAVSGRSYQLVPVAEERFVITEYGWELVFLRNAAGQFDRLRYFLEYGPGAAVRRE